MSVATIGVDLAKNVIQVHGVDERGKAVLSKRLRRDQVATFFANVPACLIGMEACASAHHWARKLRSFGHTVKLMAPQFVKPYVKSNKNDAADAEAILARRWPIPACASCRSRTASSRQCWRCTGRGKAL